MALFDFQIYNFNNENTNILNNPDIFRMGKSIDLIDTNDTIDTIDLIDTIANTKKTYTIKDTLNNVTYIYSQRVLGLDNYINIFENTPIPKGIEIR
jgi:hypothetical protein